MPVTRTIPEPPNAPRGWPPRRDGRVIDHARRNLAWYVLGVGLLTLAGVGWTIAEVRRQADELALLQRLVLTEEKR